VSTIWNRRWRVVALLALGLFAACDNGADASTDGAVILVYHHVAKDTPASTSVTPGEFRTHLDFLEDNAFNVVSLQTIVDAFRNGRELPDRTIAITFDDAYSSVHDIAMPMLRKRGWPFTVFVSTDSLDQKLRAFMSWDDVRSLVDGGGTIGNHSASHAHFIRRLDGESSGNWSKRIRQDIVQAQRRIEDEIGSAPTMFAFPFGEYDAATLSIVRDLDLVPIGQHSGAAHRSHVETGLPRFPVNRSYAGLDTLRDKLFSLPLPVRVYSPDDGVLDGPGQYPTLEVNWPSDLDNREQLTCFVSGAGKAEIQWDGDRARIRTQKPLGFGRSKYNCTLPSTLRPGRFHWFSYTWMVPKADGSWYAE